MSAATERPVNLKDHGWSLRRAAPGDYSAGAPDPLGWVYEQAGTGLKTPPLPNPGAALKAAHKLHEAQESGQLGGDAPGGEGPASVPRPARDGSHWLALADAEAEAMGTVNAARRESKRKVWRALSALSEAYGVGELPEALFGLAEKAQVMRLLATPDAPSPDDPFMTKLMAEAGLDTPERYAAAREALLGVVSEYGPEEEAEPRRGDAPVYESQGGPVPEGNDAGYTPGSPMPWSSAPEAVRGEGAEAAPCDECGEPEEAEVHDLHGEGQAGVPSHRYVPARGNDGVDGPEAAEPETGPEDPVDEGEEQPDGFPNPGAGFSAGLGQGDFKSEVTFVGRPDLALFTESELTGVSDSPVVSQIHPSKVTTHPSTLMRAGGLDPDHVEDLRAEIRAGRSLPPVDLFYDGSTHWLADGNHRHAAAEAEGAVLDVRVHKGSLRDAALHLAPR